MAVIKQEGGAAVTELVTWVTLEMQKADNEVDQLTKESDGGGFGDGGGTVFTSTDAGIFTPTYSDRSTRQKNNKKKRTGIDRLADFVMDNSPERKMVKTDELSKQNNDVSIDDQTSKVTEENDDELLEETTDPNDAEITTEEENPSGEVDDIPSELGTEIVNEEDTTPNEEEPIDGDEIDLDVEEDTDNISQLLQILNK
tara:strand:+ start:241 stop:837 length:597 start_codon:yes stop_codon:yes gene_type:complete